MIDVRHELTHLALDALALRVMNAFSAAGVRTLLLKGPVTTRWLYESPSEHPYTDLDLLVDPQCVVIAERVLTTTFEADDFHAGVLGVYRPPHERAWITPSGVVDLHVALHEKALPQSQRIWDDLWASRENFSLRGREVPVMSVTARALQVILHAERSPSAKAARDREKALALLPESIWPSVLDIARDWSLDRHLHQSLLESEAGTAVAVRLRLSTSATVASTLTGRAMPEAVAIERLIRTRRWREVMHWWQSTPHPDLTRRRVVMTVRLLPAFAQVIAAWVRTRGARVAPSRSRTDRKEDWCIESATKT